MYTIYIQKVCVLGESKDANCDGLIEEDSDCDGLVEEDANCDGLIDEDSECDGLVEEDSDCDWTSKSDVAHLNIHVKLIFKLTVSSIV